MRLPDLDTLRLLRTGYARLAIKNPEALPLFERIDADYADLEALTTADPVIVARRKIEQLRERAA